MDCSVRFLLTPPLLASLSSIDVQIGDVLLQLRIYDISKLQYPLGILLVENKMGEVALLLA